MGKFKESGPEQEVERFLRSFLKGTEFEYKTYAVGGYVRDEVMGNTSKDLDIVLEIDGGAKKITQVLFDSLNKHCGDTSIVSHPLNMGESYPIWQITFKEDISTITGERYHTKGAVVEFVDTMKESFPDDKSRQRTVEYASLEEDIARRDFTVNMGLKDLTTGEYKLIKAKDGKVVDFVSDIKNCVLRGHPDNETMDGTFSADPLRLMRLVRFYAKYDFKVPEDIRESVRRVGERITIISKERIRDEFIKILELRKEDDGVVRGKTRKAIEFMREVGLLKYAFPEIEALNSTDQSGPYHLEGNVFVHTMMVLDEAPATLYGQLSALIHDIGKPSTATVKDGGQISFNGHEEVGGSLAESFLRGLKFKKVDVGRLRSMVEYHTRPYQILGAKPSRVKTKLREFVDAVGEDLAFQIFDLARADGMGKDPQDVGGLQNLREALVVLLRDTPEELKKVPITGQDIKEILGAKGGPIIGRAKKAAIKAMRISWDRYGVIMTKEECLKIVSNQFLNKS